MAAAALAPAVWSTGATAAQASSAPSDEIQEVVVTAQKREERLIDVPISVAVVTGEVIDDFKITALDELDRLVPSLYINSTPGNNAVFVRGIGSTAGNLSVEQSVAPSAGRLGEHGRASSYLIAPTLALGAGQCYRCHAFSDSSRRWR